MNENWRLSLVITLMFFFAIGGLEQEGIPLLYYAVVSAVFGEIAVKLGEFIHNCRR